MGVDMNGPASVSSAMPWQHVWAGNIVGGVLLVLAAWWCVVSLWPKQPSWEDQDA